MATSFRLLTLVHSQSNDDAPAPGDPLQPLRTMADRVGKEVEKFAERLDHWHTHGNDNKQTKYQSTVRLVGKYKDYAETQIKDLKRAHDDEHKGELQRSVRRKVQDMADAPDADAQSMFASSALSRPSNTAQASKQLDEIRQWQAELATWELARIMIEQRYPEPLTDAAAAKQQRLAATGGNKRYSKNSDVWDRFLLEDDEAKEKALVLRWLEETARRDRSDLDSITTELEKQSGRGAHTWTSGWLDTKSKIKQAKRLEASAGPLKPDGAKLTTADGTQPLVTQLDPDAPARQRRHLERPDEYYERALWMVCYEMLRRGMPWNQICEWAQDRNEAWRGVSVGAACEAHPNGGPNLAGPTAGYLFRRMCFYASRGARSPYEGAVYGLLSGDAKLAQAACRTWDDHLHAHYNALLLSRFDTYLQQDHAGCPARVNQSLAQKFVFQDAVAKLGGWDDASQRVIGLLSQQKSTASEAVEPLKLIQGALISGTIPELLLKVGTGIADMLQADERPNNLMMHPDCDQDKYGPKPKGEGRAFPAERHHQALVSDPHAFRILVHIFIAFRNGLFSDELTAMSKRIPEWMATDNVIAAYIEFLRCAKKYTLIPLYAAQLSHTRIIHCMARVLPDIKNQEEQRQCIDNMMMYRIDIIDPISQSILFAQKNAGLTHFNVEMDTIITEPITRFKILEEAKPSDDSPWPGYRIRQGFEGSPIGAEEDAIVEALQWLQYTANDYEQTFAHLKSSMTILLR
jgi:nuclear pore complex protein Nup107